MKMVVVNPRPVIILSTSFHDFTSCTQLMADNKQKYAVNYYIGVFHRFPAVSAVLEDEMGQFMFASV